VLMACPIWINLLSPRMLRVKVWELRSGRWSGHVSRHYIGAQETPTPLHPGIFSRQTAVTVLAIGLYLRWELKMQLKDSAVLKMVLTMIRDGLKSNGPAHIKPDWRSRLHRIRAIDADCPAPRTGSGCCQFAQSCRAVTVVNL